MDDRNYAKAKICIKTNKQNTTIYLQKNTIMFYFQIIQTYFLRT